MRLRVTAGSSSDPPSATVRTASMRRSGDDRLGRNPLAPAGRARQTYSSYRKVVRVPSHPARLARVEVAHGRLGHARRLAKSFENTSSSATGWLQVACIATTLRHLSRGRTRRLAVGLAA